MVLRHNYLLGNCRAWKRVLRGAALLLLLVLGQVVLLLLKSTELQKRIATTSKIYRQQMYHFFAPNYRIPVCPYVPPDIQGGPFQAKVVPLEEMERRFPALEPGGAWRPQHCASRQRVAVVVPFRDRPQHLPVLLSTLHTMLPRQLLDYRIFVVEQADFRYFNRGLLMNIGFVVALKLSDFQCFIFHDVDLIPEDDRNLYLCIKNPRHMSVAIDVYNYSLPYEEIFGGVCSMTKEQFQSVNGFSNVYWGWGGEDDDMYLRVQNAGFDIVRYPETMSRYRMLKHDKQVRKMKDRNVQCLEGASTRFRKDGLNSLRYTVKEIRLVHAYTHVLVELTTPI